MSAGPLVVVKVGGSLFDLPDLGERLRRLLTPRPRALLVPGGGLTADAIRALDRIHRLGEEASHWLAIRALGLNAHVLARLLPEARVCTDLPGRETLGWHILDPLPFFERDEANADRLPHQWHVTSDSLAVRVAVAAAATELLLLKSVDAPSGASWEEAARVGVVDGYFPEAIRRAGPALTVRVVNGRGASAGRC